MKDYYKILGVSHSANEVTIKTAFRKHALKLHPDINKSPSAILLFQEISEAYNVLGNPDKKKKYDLRFLYNIEPVIVENHGRDWRKYGRSQPRDPREPVPPNPESSFSQEELRQFSLLEKYLFLSLLILSLLAIFNGVMDLLRNEWTGLSDLTGLLFGCFFCFLLVYTYYKIFRK